MSKLKLIIPPAFMLLRDFPLQGQSFKFGRPQGERELNIEGVLEKSRQLPIEPNRPLEDLFKGRRVSSTSIRGRYLCLLDLLCFQRNFADLPESVRKMLATGANFAPAGTTERNSYLDVPYLEVIQGSPVVKFTSALFVPSPSDRILQISN